MLAEECRISKASHVEGFVLWKPLDVVAEAFIPERRKRTIIAAVKQRSRRKDDFLLTTFPSKSLDGKTAFDFEIIASFTTRLLSGFTLTGYSIHGGSSLRNGEREA